jgi:predicted SAM-dependent methyltransferase
MTKPSPDVLAAKIRALAGTRKILLHVGCGPEKTARLPTAFRDAKKWFVLRLDRDAKVRPHIIAEARDLHMLPDACIDALWVEVLETVAPAEVPQVVAGFFRVLRMGGEMVIETPDLQTVAAYVAQGKLDEPIDGGPSPHALIYGEQSPSRTGFTYASLAQILKTAGFTTLTFTRQRITLLTHARKLAKGHSARREKAVIERSPDFNAREAVVASSAELEKLPHPGARWKGKLADELDVPPAKI